MNYNNAVIKVRAPATSANLGAGFDSIGIALSLYNIVTIKKILPPEEFILEISGEGSGEGSKDLLSDLSSVKSNLIITSYLEACSTWGIAEPQGFEMHSNNAIPLCRGLGSSASAVVSGVLIAKKLHDLNKSDAEVLRVMTKIEGHPDNVVPCFLGGMTVSCWDSNNYGNKHENELKYVRFPSLPDDMYVVIAVPDVKVNTSDARKSLPTMVNFSDAVFNLGRAALMSAAWATNQWDMLSWGMDDRLHQQYRTKLFPGGEVIMDRVRSVPGCLGVAISGSGPSVLALSRGKPSAVAEAMCRTFSEYGVNSLFFVLEGNVSGAEVERK